MNTARGVRTVAVLLVLAGCSSGGGGLEGKGGSGAGAGGSGGQAGAASEAAGSGPGGAAGTIGGGGGGGSTGVAGAGGSGGTAGVAGTGGTTGVAGAGGTTGVAAGNSSIAAGFRHTCAIKSDGTLACWGYNSSAQLGSGDRNSYSTPNTVAGLAGVTASCDRRQRYLRDSQRRQSLLLGQLHQYSARARGGVYRCQSGCRRRQRTSVSSTTPTPCGARAITPQGSWAMATARHPVPHRCL